MFLSKELRPYLKLSLGFHITLFLIFGVKVLIFPDLSDFDQDGTIKVDMVALPNKEDNKYISKSKAQKEEKIEPKKEIEKPKPVVKKPEPQKPAQQAKKPDPTPDPTINEASAFQKLKELEAIKKLEENSASNSAPAEESQPATEIKGNRIAVGDSITGVNKIQYTNYKKVLHDAVKSKWNLPSWIQDGNLFAEALVKISDTGHITEKLLTTSSGNSMYDKYVLDAISEASPFPAPPDKFVNVVGIKGVVLRFP